ncbi:MAG: S-layer homology domain-containing protein, partial [Peptostreptococcaceae bacterium]|nr:S-layer homology domain-containing protein [Peptostreptococcaceae bacterium]
LANYYKNITVPNSYNVDFKDNSKIPNWSKEAIKKVVYMKIMKGRTNSNFDPNQNITRAEIATIIYNMNNLK